MRKRIYEAIEYARASDRLSNFYNFFMMAIIVMSIIPLMFKTRTLPLIIIDKIAVSVFILEYIVRLATANYKLKKGKLSFLIYPFTPMAILDLICILPSLSIINGGFRLLKLFRLFQTFRVFKLFGVVRRSRSKRIIYNAFQKQKKTLATVLVLAFVYIWVAALVVFNVEPNLFKNFFEALYWATVSLTTMGYGDITPITPMGRFITIISAIFGIAIIALPSGIITAGLMEEIGKEQKDREQKNDEQKDKEQEEKNKKDGEYE